MKRLNPHSLPQHFVSSVCEHVPLLRFPFLHYFVTFIALSERVSINANIVFATKASCLSFREKKIAPVSTNRFQFL